MATRGAKGHFYCIQKYFYSQLRKQFISKNSRGGTSKGAQPKVAYRERTHLVHAYFFSMNLNMVVRPERVVFIIVTTHCSDNSL